MGISRQRLGQIMLLYIQKIKKKTKIPRVTDDEWNFQKQLSGPMEKKRRRKLLYPHPKLSLPIGLTLK